MSKISGKQFGEPFKMRVVSGMLVNGSIRISWATGKPASSQLDWGFDESVSNRTDEFNTEPKDMTRYHILEFPDVFMDREHFFRVRSRTAADQVGVSPVYSVIVPDSLRFGMDEDLLIAEHQLEIKQVGLQHSDLSNFSTHPPSLASEPLATAAGQELTHQSTLNPVNFESEQVSNGLEAIITITIDNE
jgi:hypothetical protein